MPVRQRFTNVEGTGRARRLRRDATPHEGMVWARLRTEYLEGRAFRVLRFWNSEVSGNLDGVLARIVEAVRERGEGGDA